MRCRTQVPCQRPAARAAPASGGGPMPHAGRSCCRKGALRSGGRDPLAGHTKPGATRLRAASRSGSCGRRWHGIARGHPARARMGPSGPGLSPGESRPIPDVRCPQADVRGIGGGQRRAARYAMHGSAAGVGGGSGRVAADACPETDGQTPGDIRDLGRRPWPRRAGHRSWRRAGSRTRVMRRSSPARLTARVRGNTRLCRPVPPRRRAA